MEIGTIKMRSPSGNRTSFTVHVNDRGCVELHASRSSEGEVLIQLRKETAQRLGEILLAAVKVLKAVPTP